MLNRNDRSPDPHAPEVLTTVANEIEAAGVVAGLEARGITASAVGDFTAGFRAEAPGAVSIMVRRCDLERARAALVELERENAEIDWSQIDVGRPEE